MASYFPVAAFIAPHTAASIEKKHACTNAFPQCLYCMHSYTYVRYVICMYTYVCMCMDNVASLQTSLSLRLKPLLSASHFYLMLSTSGTDR